MRSRRTPTFALCLVIGVLTVPAIGCSSDDDEVKPSPIPPGYAMLLARHGGEPPAPGERDESGETVDELLAVVDGTHLTRLEVLRRLRLPEGAAKDGDREEEIRAARLTWAQQRIVNAAARRAGIKIPPSFIDKQAQRILDGQRRTAEKESGVKISQADYLKERGLTWSEYRLQIQDAIVFQYYTTKLLEGTGPPTRPEIDYEVDPAEVRRIYYDHKKEFDIKRGVKFALLQLRIERFESDERDFLEAEELATRYAKQVALEFREGQSPETLARRYQVAEEDWTETKEFRDDFPQPEGKAWLFDSARRVPDATVFPDAGGPIVLCLQEIRQPRAQTLPEVYEDIVAFVQLGKRKRLEAQLIIDEIQRGDTVWPDELADELLDYAHAILDEISTNEVLGGTRLK
jgi:hypothetical protein